MQKLQYLDLAGVLLLLFAAAQIRQTLKKPISKVTGPWYTKWTTLVLRYKWFTGTRGQYVNALHARYGPIVRLGPDEVDICDAKAYKEIYTVRETYVKTPWYASLGGRATHNMFNTNDAAYHRRIRRLLSAPMSESALATRHGFVDSKVRLAVERIRQEMASKGAADLYKWFMFMATDVIGDLTFGESFKMLEQDEASNLLRNQYSIDVEGIARTGATYSTFVPFDGVIAKLPVPLFRRTRRTTQNMLAYAQKSIERHQRLVEEDPEKDDANPTLFSKMYKAHEAGEVTRRELRDNSLSYIVAGSDTTAVTLTYLFWAVLSHPAIRAELLAEIEALAAGGNGDGDGDGDIGEEELRSAKYLNWTIDETLRLYGAAPSGLLRRVPDGGATLAGQYLDGGTTVACQAFSLHRNEEVFRDAEKFDPRRWEHPTKEMKESFVPFGGGSRVCIGLHLARMEMRYAVFRFFGMFPDARLAVPEDDMTPETYFVMAPKAHRCLVSCC